MFVSFIIRFRGIILAISIMAILGLAWTLASRLISDDNIIDNSVSIWFLQDDPEFAAYDMYNQNSGQREWTFCLLETASIDDPVFLRELAQISDAIEGLEHVYRVVSIAGINEELRHHGSLESLLVRAGDNRHTAVLIENDNLIRNQTPYRIQLVDSIRAIVARYPTIEQFSLAGTTVLNAELNRTSQRDVLVFYFLISGMIVVFGLSSLRNLRDFVVLIVVVIATIIPTMGLIAWLEIPFNMVTVMLPTVLIALAVADVIHLINEFHICRESMSGAEAISKTIKHLWKPGLLTSLTTVVGFVSLAPSTVLPIRQLGLFAAFGIILAWIVTMVVAPGLLFGFWPDGKRRRRGSKRDGVLISRRDTGVTQPVSQSWVGVAANPPRAGRITSFAMTYRKPLIVLSLLLLLPLVGLMQLEVDTDYSKFFGRETDLSLAYDHIGEAEFPQSLINLLIRPSMPDRSHRNGTDAMARLSSRIERLPGVIKVVSMDELLAQLNFVAPHSDLQGVLRRVEGFTTVGGVFADGGQGTRLRENGASTNRHRLVDLAADDSTETVRPRQGTHHLQILTLALSSGALFDLKDDIRAAINETLSPEAEMKLMGTTALWANMDAHVSRTQLYSLLGICLFLLILLPGVFHSWRMAMIALLFSFLPLGITLGLMGLLHIKINIATALIGGICMGIVVDDTLHLLTRLQTGLKSGLDLNEAVDHAIEAVGRSIIMTSVILIGAFISMATSDFLPTAHFGIFMSLSIALGLFFDLFILPMVLKRFLGSHS